MSSSRMHHACALQRIHLVQLYLSCLDFNLQAKDSEGNTCLHYVAITGNCEIADLLMNAAEKMNLRLDQYVNREGQWKNFSSICSNESPCDCHLGCSAAVLALRYGHIECANQITHRDCDEFFVIPRPLSIYETPPSSNPSAVQTTTKSRKKNKDPSPSKADLPPSALSFGLLKIIFNESDSSYSTRLAAVCKKEKSGTHRRRKKTDLVHGLTTLDSAKSTVTDEIHYCSTEALVNELQRQAADEVHRASPENSSAIPNSGRTSPRLQLLMHQYSIDKTSMITDESLLINSSKKMSKGADENHDVKSKLSFATVQKQMSNSTLNHFEENLAHLHDSPRSKQAKQVRVRTAIVRPPTSTNAVGVPSRLSSVKSPSSTSQPTRKKKSLLVQRASSASTTSKQQPSNIPVEISTYSQTLYAGRPLSAAVLHHPLPVAQASDSSCSIREARGPTRRYNNPEEVFGLKPEQLFGSQEQHVPRLMSQRQTRGETRSKRSQRPRQAFAWQDDVDKLVDLYNIHHSSTYRTTVVPPLSSTHVEPTDIVPDLIQITRSRKAAASRNSSSSGRTPKLSTLASLQIPRRNSITQRQSIKVAHT
jgi:hypothetical protein